MAAGVVQSIASAYVTGGRIFRHLFVFKIKLSFIIDDFTVFVYNNEQIKGKEILISCVP